MPTVEADVAFGLGKYPDMSLEEVKSRVITALDAVGMRDYMQVRSDLCVYSKNTKDLFFFPNL